jgi:hypothetical protein
LVGSETIGYGYASGNTLYNCVRGQNNTTAAAHTVGDGVYVQNLPAITVWPTPDNSQTYHFGSCPAWWLGWRTIWRLKSPMVGNG